MAIHTVAFRCLSRCLGGHEQPLPMATNSVQLVLLQTCKSPLEDCPARSLQLHIRVKPVRYELFQSDAAEAHAYQRGHLHFVLDKAQQLLTEAAELIDIDENAEQRGCDQHHHRG